MSDDQNTGGTTLGPETSSLRSIQFTIDGEPGTLITVAETETGALAFSIKVTDTITSSFDKPDIADLRGLFFHVSNESLLSGLLITGSHVTSSSVSANKVIDLKNGVNMNGLGHFDIGVEFGTPGMSTDDIQETTFTLTHTSQPLTIEFVTEQGFGARLTSVSDDGIGRELSLKLVGQSPEAPLLPPPAEDEDGDDDEDVPPPPAENESGDDDDLIEAGADDDTIFGGPGNDEMQGEGGDDLIIGGRDNGHLGDGTLLSVIIGDNLYGNDGRDTFVFSKGDGVDLIWDFQPGMDRVLVSGYTLADVDQVAFVGDVTNRIATGGHQKLALILKEASDAIIFNDFPNPSAQDVAIQFADGSALSSAELLARASASSSAAGFSSTIINGSTTIPASTASLEQAGSNSGDTLTGGAGNDKLYGNGGGDLLTGREGADKLYGADGTDLIYGDSVEQLPADLLAYFTGSPSVVPAPAHAGSAVPVEALPSSALIPPPTTEKISTTIDVVNSWWGGFQGQITVTANESVSDWDLVLRSTSRIDGVWNAAKVNETSQNGVISYTLDDAGWNKTLNAGQAITIGFNATTGVNGVLSASDILATLSVGKVVPAPTPTQTAPLLPAVPAEEVTAKIEVSNSWWGGFQGQITVTAQENISDWDISLHSSHKIDNVWNAQKGSETVSDEGFVYDIDDAGWNGTLLTGQTVTIGFTATTGYAGVISNTDLVNSLWLL